MQLPRRPIGGADGRDLCKLVSGLSRITAQGTDLRRSAERKEAETHTETRTRSRSRNLYYAIVANA